MENNIIPSVHLRPKQTLYVILLPVICHMMTNCSWSLAFCLYSCVTMDKWLNFSVLCLPLKNEKDHHSYIIGLLCGGNALMLSKHLL